MEEINEDGRYKKYMRDYRRRKYSANPEEIQAKNKMYYYKTKFGLSADELKKYGLLLPEVGKLKKAIKELEDKDTDVLREVLTSYL